MVTEPTLFDFDKGYVNYTPFQPHSPTSFSAAQSIKPDTVTLRERVFRCILTCGPITDEGIQAATNMSGDTERPRRIELEKRGRIVQQGTKRTSKGNDAAAWVVAS